MSGSTGQEAYAASYADITFDTRFVIAAHWDILIAKKRGRAGVISSIIGASKIRFIGAKGQGTVAETLLSTQVMYNVSKTLFSTPNRLLVGVEYQYWHNKFGNSANSTPGTKASTPMVRVDYHF